MKQLLLSCLTCLLLPTLGMAGEADSTFTPHTMMEEEEIRIEKNVDEKEEMKKKKSLITRFLDYFNDANKKNDKRFDFSIIGGPHYATDTKLGLGLVAAGIYRSDPADTLLLPPMCRSLAMSARWASICSVCAEPTSSPTTVTVPSTPSTSIPSPASSGEWDTTWATTTTTRAT